MMRRSATSWIQEKDYRVEAFPLPDSIERRSKVRFPLDLRVRYRTIGPGYPPAGVGSVINISSSGVLVANEHEISAGTQLELNIEWPLPLDGRIPMQLLAVGKVVRSESSSFAVALERYRFRTMNRITSMIAKTAELPIGEALKRTLKKVASA